MGSGESNQAVVVGSEQAAHPVIAIGSLRRGLRKLDGQTGFQKNCKTPFFSRYSNFLLMGDWNWSKNYPVFFFLKNLNKYGR